MKVKIQSYIVGPDYRYYPGQIIEGHPDTEKWLNDGKAVAVQNKIETATLPRKRK
jgi:hypothetical protein